MLGRRLFIFLYMASGAAALVYEVVWTRLFTLQLGHTVAATSTVLAAFMGGLAIGAWVAGRFSRENALTDSAEASAVSPSVTRKWQAVPYLQIYAALEIGIALYGLLLPAMLAAFVPALAWAYADGTAPARFAMARVAIALAVLGVPAAAMGATFPIAAQWWAESEEHSRGSAADAGVLYAANTAGAAVGAIASGFVLIPWVGLRATTWMGVALNLVSAGGAFALATKAGAAKVATEQTRRGSAPNPGSHYPTAHSPHRGGPGVARGGLFAPLRSLAGALRAPTTIRRSHREQNFRIAPSRGPKEAPRLARASRSSAQSPAHSPSLASIAAGISGFTALVYEVAWTRLLALVIGPTTYAFATMAAAFIGGLAIGSSIGTRIARRTNRSGVWLGSVLAAGAVAAVAAASYAATKMPLLIAARVVEPAVDFRSVVMWQAVRVTLLLLPMTCALGAAFPLALAVAGGHAATAARDASRVYAANTAGAIAGALVAGFILIPRVGLQATIVSAGWLGALTGAGCLAIALRNADRGLPNEHRKSPISKSAVRSPQSVIRLAPLLTAGGTALMAIGLMSSVPAWDRELLASGGYKYAPYIASGDLEAGLRAGRLEYYREGAAATVSVRRLAGTRSLAIDGKVDASNGGDMLTQRLLGLLPVVLHGQAADVCIIGLGSGVTAGSALLAGTIRHTDVVEISPEVVEASRFFDRENGRALSAQSVRLIVGDGRSHLLLSPRQYDVIVSEPSNPWMAGVATLFTREFFEAARRRLKPEGLLCQWAHTYDISDEDLRSIVRTFISVFPQGTMWLVGGGDLLLIGTNGEDIALRLQRLQETWTTGPLIGALQELGIEKTAASFDLLSLLAGGPHELRQYAGSAVIQTDNRTALEYSAPRGIYGRSSGENAAAIRALTPPLPPALRSILDQASDTSWTSRGRMLLKAEAFGFAYDAFLHALTLNSRNNDALSGLSDAAAGAHKTEEERDWLRAVAEREPANAAVRLEISRVLAATGDFQGAIGAANEALRLTPSDPAAGEQLASVFADAGDAEHLAALADTLTSRFPDRPNARYFRASALFLQGRAEEAIREARRVTDINPLHARAQNLIGAACATLGRDDCAVAAFEASIRGNPRDPSTYVNLGLLRLQRADVRAAAAAFAEALAIDPASMAARNGLAQARSRMTSDPH